MAYINLLPADIYILSGSTYAPGKTLGFSVQSEQIVSLSGTFTTGKGGVNLLFLIYQKDGNEIATAFIDENSDCAKFVKNSSDFLSIGKNDIWKFLGTQLTNKQSKPLWVNRQLITKVVPSSALTADGVKIYQLHYEEGLIERIIYTSASTFARATNQDAHVDFHPSTELIYVNELSLCYDVQIVNHETGVSNIFHTPHPASGWYLNSRYNVTPYGGFLAVFTPNDNSRYFLYFFDNEGNLVDQIDGAGPGYDWGNTEYRLVYGEDNDSEGSTLKIFDGKNIRTHEFPGLCFFNLDPWSEGECSKNLYVPFGVYNQDEDKDYLYVSTPGGGLIELDEASWYNGESFTTVHSCSDKIFRMLEDGNGFYTKLEMYNEDMVLLSTLRLRGLNLNDYSTREYYGADGNFFIALYNWDDNSVPYLFVSVNAQTSKFETFTAENSNTFRFDVLERNYDIYDSYNSKSANSVVVITGQDPSGSSPVGDMNSIQNGATIHWTSTATGKWLSFKLENESGDDVLYSSGSGSYGNYPMFIVFAGDAPTDELAEVILLPSGVEFSSTGIALEDAINVETHAVGELTMSIIEYTGGLNEVQWNLYSDSRIVNYNGTSNNYTLTIQGSTLSVLDLDDSNRNWSYSPDAGYVQVGNGFPTPITGGEFNRVDDDFGASYPIFGYNNNGAQVLLDRDLLNNSNFVGLYFLTENSNGWVHVVNTFDDQGGSKINYQVGKKHYFYLCENQSLSKFYAMVYNMTTGALVSGVSLDTAAGPLNWDQVGDRMWATQEIAPDIYNYYFFTKKGVVQQRVDGTLGFIYRAYNDADWSRD